VADLIYVLIVVIFFAVSVLYVRGCERIVRGSEGTDPAGDATT